jgi:hypothetical protein
MATPASHLEISLKKQQHEILIKFIFEDFLARKLPKLQAAEYRTLVGGISLETPWPGFL